MRLSSHWSSTWGPNSKEAAHWTPPNKMPGNNYSLQKTKSVSPSTVSSLIFTTHVSQLLPDGTDANSYHYGLSIAVCGSNLCQLGTDHPLPPSRLGFGGFKIFKRSKEEFESLVSLVSFLSFSCLFLIEFRPMNRVVDKSESTDLLSAAVRPLEMRPWCPRKPPTHLEHRNHEQTLWTHQQMTSDIFHHMELQNDQSRGTIRAKQQRPITKNVQRNAWYIFCRWGEHFVLSERTEPRAAWALSCEDKKCLKEKSTKVIKVKGNKRERSWKKS